MHAPLISELYGVDRLITVKREEIVMTKRVIVIFAIVALAVVSVVQPAFAAEPFYSGKRLTVFVNFAPGGPTDVEGRVFARHVGRHLPGNTGVIVQNMDGAAGLVGRNYLGEIAPRDGTMVGYFTGAAFQYANDSRQHRVDFLKYEFVAFQPGASVYFVRSDVAPGIKQSVDIMKAQNVVVGGLGADNSKDILLRLTLDILGVKHGYVTGYKGAQGARLAFQTGEINFYAESPPTYRSIIAPSLVARGEAVPLFHDPNFDGQSFSEPKQMEGLNIPAFQDFYQQVHGRPPSGILWEVYKTVIALDGAMRRMVVFPPNTPSEAIAAMQNAINKLNDDAVYRDDAMKAFGFVPEWVADSDTNAKVRKNLVLSPEVRRFMEEYISKASQRR